MNKSETKRKVVALTTTHRGKDSSMFTGRPQGKQVRSDLKLSDCDNDDFIYEITIPKGTLSFNPSFYLGLLFESIKHFKTFEQYSEKYILSILETEEDIKTGLRIDLDDCERQARNELNKKTGLSFFK